MKGEVSSPRHLQPCPFPRARGPFSETRLHGALVANASTTKPRVLPYRQLEPKDISTIMRPPSVRTEPGYTRLRHFLGSFKDRHKLPLLMQFPLFITTSPVVESLPTGLILRTIPEVFDSVSTILAGKYSLIVQLQPADLLVVHWQLGPVFTVRTAGQSTWARCLLIGETTGCLVELGTKARLSLPLLQEFHALHSWQVFGLSNGAADGNIPHQFINVCAKEGTVGIWQPCVADGPTLIFQPDYMISRLAYPALWLLVVLAVHSGCSTFKMHVNSVRSFL